MTAKRPDIEPIRSDFRLDFHGKEQLDRLQAATLEVLEEVGIHFPSEKALDVLAGHGAKVDSDTQIARIPPDVVKKAMSTVPRYFHLGARDPSCDLHLEDGVTFCATDGCGVETIDFETREPRPSRKDDVAKMAHIADYLSSISFYWPMVSAQDCGETAPLHELEASWNNTVKHVQSETIMGEPLARYAIEMATVMAGSADEIRRRPPFSLLVCCIDPLAQDRDGIEGALLLAEAGIPVGFMSMVTMGTTGPATMAGSLVVGDAEIIGATVLMQLAHPGAPVFHSLIYGRADPRSGRWVGYPLDNRASSIIVELPHHWGMPTLAGIFGTDAPVAGSWQSAADTSTDVMILGLTGAEMAHGMGLTGSYMRLYPEELILEDDLYHRGRYDLLQMEISDETLALDVIRSVGPRGHFLAEKHTRRHIRDAMKPSISQQMDAEGGYRDPVEVAREKVGWILDNYRPEPMEKEKKAELSRILAAADRELRA